MAGDRVGLMGAARDNQSADRPVVFRTAMHSRPVRELDADEQGCLKHNYGVRYYASDESHGA